MSHEPTFYAFNGSTRNTRSSTAARLPAFGSIAFFSWHFSRNGNTLWMAPVMSSESHPFVTSLRWLLPLNAVLYAMNTLRPGWYIATAFLDFRCHYD